MSKTNTRPVGAGQWAYKGGRIIPAGLRAAARDQPLLVPAAGAGSTIIGTGNRRLTQRLPGLKWMEKRLGDNNVAVRGVAAHAGVGDG